MKVLVATASATGAPDEQTPTPDWSVPERQMPLFPVPLLETPLLLQPLLPVPELGWQVDCGSGEGSRGKREAAVEFIGDEEGEAIGAKGNCGSSDCCDPSGEASATGSSSRIDSREKFIVKSLWSSAVT